MFTGRLDHEELAEVLPACSALVVPSTFPEAFGMVAVEAGACGALPISAAHSGLAEVSRELAGDVPPEAAAWLSFPVDDGAVQALGERLVAWLGADSALQDRTRTALVAAVRERWSWQGVARGVIAAAAENRSAGPLGRVAPLMSLGWVCIGVLARSVGALLGAVCLLFVLAGCGDVPRKANDANLIVGKQQFVAKCGSCHTLARANTKGTIGPNLDEAFRTGDLTKAWSATRFARSSKDRCRTPIAKG